MKLQHSVWTPKPNIISGVFYSVNSYTTLCQQNATTFLTLIQNIIMEFHTIYIFNFIDENVKGHILMFHSL